MEDGDPIKILLDKITDKGRHMFNMRFQEVLGFLVGPEGSEERIGVCYPALDVFENSKELCIEVEIPGIHPEEVNVEIIGRLLRISGMKQDPLENKGIRYVRMERSFGRFSRELEIPERFDLDKVDAKFADGVLIVKIARATDNVEVVKRITVE